MKGLYIIECKVLKDNGELKFGMTAIGYNQRIKDYTNFNNPYYIALYQMPNEHSDKIRTIEQEILNKTKHMKSKLFGSEFRKIQYEELNKVIIETLNNYPVIYKHITENVMFKVLNNITSNDEPYLEGLIMYSGNDIQKFAKAFEKHYDNVRFMRKSVKNDGGSFLRYLFMEDINDSTDCTQSRNVKHFKCLKKDLQSIESSKRFMITLFTIIVNHESHDMYLILDTEKKKINYFIYSTDENKQDVPNCDNIFNFIKTIDNYQDYTIGYTGDNISQRCSKVINKLLGVSNDKNYVELTRNAIPIHCGYYFLHQVINEQYDIAGPKEIMSSLLKYAC